MDITRSLRDVNSSRREDDDNELMQYATFKHAFDGIKRDLSEMLDPLYGFLLSLLDKKVIEEEHFLSIKNEPVTHVKVMQLIFCLERRDSRYLLPFCKALRECNQRDVLQKIVNNVQTKMQPDSPSPELCTKRHRSQDVAISVTLLMPPADAVDAAVSVRLLMPPPDTVDAAAQTSPSPTSASPLLVYHPDQNLTACMDSTVTGITGQPMQTSCSTAFRPRSSSSPGCLSSCASRSNILHPQKLNGLPVEMLEVVLMRAFLMLCGIEFKLYYNSQLISCLSAKSRLSEQASFEHLASVCYYWHLTLVGFQQSPTSKWVRHQLRKLIEISCRPFRRSAAMQYMYELDDNDDVWGVTQMHDVVYMVFPESSTIERFNATTHQRLTDINVKDLRMPWNITSCERTSHVYIADALECVWRVSSDGEDIKRCWSKSPSDTFTPWSLSVTSSQLLVTSRKTMQLMQLDVAGEEIRRVQLPYYMVPQHAVESPTGTFIVVHHSIGLDQYQVSEVNTEGQVLRHFGGSRLLPLRCPENIAVDSQGNIFVADTDNRRVLLLDAQLALCRVIIDEHQLNRKKPRSLCYKEQSGQLLVALDHNVAVFDVLQC